MFQIRNLERCAGTRPYWKAELVSGPTRIQVHKRWGSWFEERPDGTRTHLHFDWAERLQAKVRQIERRERKTTEQETTCPA